MVVFERCPYELFTYEVDKLCNFADCAMNEETVIVGDASGCFLYRSADSSRDNHADMNLDAVALVFARDKHKSDGTS